MQRRRLETLAAVAAQRRRRGLKGRRKAAQRRYWRLYAAAVAWAGVRPRAPVSIETARRRRATRAVLHPAAPGAEITKTDARAALPDAREACLTAQRVLRGPRAPRRRAAAAGAPARGGSSAIARVRGVPLLSFLRHQSFPRRRQASRARLPAVAPGHEAREAPGRARSAGGAFGAPVAVARDAPAVPDAFPVARARATRMRRDAAWAAWRAAFQKRRRDDAIRAFQAARGGELLRGCSPPNAATRRRRRRPPPFLTTIMKRRRARCRRGGASSAECGPRADGVDGRFVCRVHQ